MPNTLSETHSDTIGRQPVADATDIAPDSAAGACSKGAIGRRQGASANGGAPASPTPCRKPGRGTRKPGSSPRGRCICHHTPTGARCRGRATRFGCICRTHARSLFLASMVDGPEHDAERRRLALMKWDNVNELRRPR